MRTRVITLGNCVVVRFLCSASEMVEPMSDVSGQILSDMRERLRSREFVYDPDKGSSRLHGFLVLRRLAELVTRSATALSAAHFAY